MLQFDTSLTTNSNAVIPEIPATVGTNTLLLDFVQAYDKSETKGVVATLLNTVGPTNPWLIFSTSGSEAPTPTGLYNVSIYEYVPSGSNYIWHTANMLWINASFTWTNSSGAGYGNLLLTERAFVSGSNGYNITQYLSPTNGGTYTTYNHP
jgi:hypothetical protein